MFINLGSAKKNKESNYLDKTQWDKLCVTNLGRKVPLSVRSLLDGNGNIVFHGGEVLTRKELHALGFKEAAKDMDLKGYREPIRESKNSYIYKKEKEYA